ncbi:hypothetical protein ABZV29_38130 [Streptomyces sp. NPDC005236]|uniref:hypothetical protein n=1 Tax=Streptomyces sp. NPDC005236 TaxID=3157028 RepID=UPI0033B646DD
MSAHWSGEQAEHPHLKIGHRETRGVNDPESIPATSQPLTVRTRVSFSVERWILAPRTTWRARRIAADFGPGMDAKTAWSMARVQRHPDEDPFVIHHLDSKQTP